MKDRLFFQMRVDAEFFRRLDDARRLEPELPSRANLARRILNEYLDLVLEKSKLRIVK